MGLNGVESADSKFSMTVDEFARMVGDVRNAKMMARGSIGEEYSLTEGEKASMVFRRSVFAVKDIGEGEMFTMENLRVIRPGYGVKPKYLEELLGKRSRQAIRRGEPIGCESLNEGDS